MAKLLTSLEEISSLKKENEEVKKKSQYDDYDLDKKRKEFDLLKLQIQERDKKLTKLKEELHQNKKNHKEEVISMINQLDKAKKRKNIVKPS